MLSLMIQNKFSGECDLLYRFAINALINQVFVRNDIRRVR